MAFAGDDLDEPVLRRMIEVVQAEHALGMLVVGRRQLGHRERRRVGREDRVGPADLVEPAEDVALHGEVLEHRLDDEIDAGADRRTVEVPVIAAEDRGRRLPAVKILRSTPSSSVLSMIASPRSTLLVVDVDER